MIGIDIFGIPQINLSPVAIQRGFIQEVQLNFDKSKLWDVLMHCI